MWGWEQQPRSGCCSAGLGPSWEIWVRGLLCLRWKQQRMFSMLKKVSLWLRHPLSPLGCPGCLPVSPSASHQGLSSTWD